MTQLSKTLNGLEWNLAVTRNMSFWHQYQSNLGHYHHMQDFGVDAKVENLAITSDGTQSHYFFHPENVKKYSAAVLDAVDSRKKIGKMRGRYEKNAEDLLNSLSACKANLTSKTWKRFVQQYQKNTAGLGVTNIIGRFGGELLEKKLREHGIAETDISRVIATITYPEQHTPLFESRLDLLSIGAKQQKGGLAEKINHELTDWLKRYESIPVNFNEDPWTLKDAQEQLKDATNKDCAKEIQLLKAGHAERMEEARVMLKNISDSEIEILALALAEGTYLNEFRKSIFSRVSLGYRGIFRQVAQKAGSSEWRDCYYLTPMEMTQIIEGEKVDMGAIKGKRSVVGYYVNSEGKAQFLAEGDAKAFNDYIESVHGQSDEGKPEREKIIAGMSASSGKVRGVVRIILDTKDFRKFAANEILVTTMTSVDFVPIMERAAAFVTNEGGVTSHASIVAREMNKPCIIGTKIATQVLKDGDEVEVDADKGIVKKL